MLKQQSQRRKDNSILLEAKGIGISNFKNNVVTFIPGEITALSLRKLSALTEMPKQDEYIHIITKNAVNSFDFIAAIADKEIILNLYIAVYRIGKKVINTIKSIQDQGRINKITFLVNDGYPKMQREGWNVLKSHESEKWQIKIENNHAKVIAIKTDSNNYVIEGSGNLSINARIEQYLFANSEGLYKFHEQWINEIN